MGPLFRRGSQKSINYASKMPDHEQRKWKTRTHTYMYTHRHTDPRIHRGHLSSVNSNIWQVPYALAQSIGNIWCDKRQLCARWGGTEATVSK